MKFDLLDNISLLKQLFYNKEISYKEIFFNVDNLIFQQGDKAHNFLIITNGQVRIDMTTRSGKDITLYRIHDDQAYLSTISALVNDGHYIAKAICETKVTAIAITSADFYKAIQKSKDFMFYIFTSYSKQIFSLVKLIDKVASKDILYDLCHWLLSKSNTIDTNIIEVTHSKIAREIGTAREVVSRKLYLLESKEAIKVTRGEIVILNRHYLEDIITPPPENN